MTSRIRPFAPGDSDPPVRDLACRNEDNRISIPWVRRDELALLEPLLRFGEDRGFFNRLQIHLSIGQAF